MNNTKGTWCSESYGCMDIFCVYKHGDGFNPKKSMNRYLETGLLPCIFGHNCTHPDCGLKYSHPVTWNFRAAIYSARMRAQKKELAALKIMRAEMAEMAVMKAVAAEAEAVGAEEAAKSDV